jgi:hypothetical protein
LCCKLLKPPHRSFHIQDYRSRCTDIGPIARSVPSLVCWEFRFIFILIFCCFKLFEFLILMDELVKLRYQVFLRWHNLFPLTALEKKQCSFVSYFFFAYWYKVCVITMFSFFKYNFIYYLWSNHIKYLLSRFWLIYNATIYKIIGKNMWFQIFITISYQIQWFIYYTMTNCENWIIW